MDWNSPTIKKHIEKAEAQGCKLLGPGKSNRYRLYQHPCGHNLEITHGHMRYGNSKCQICIDEKLLHEALEHGCELIGHGKKASNRLYELRCGHQREVETAKMRASVFRCQTCLDDKFNQKAEAGV